MCSDIFDGWRTYSGHSIREAGLGLALLYMTVLGFDTITWGYCRHQGVTESVLGLLTGVSALVGVAGARYYYKCQQFTGCKNDCCYCFFSDCFLYF